MAECKHDQLARQCYTCELEQRVAELEKQRDAAFAMSRCECGVEECCRNMVIDRDRIAELEAERLWIPVSERLPPEEENVLCYFEKGEHDVSCWFRSTRQKKIIWMCGVPPTHWMPLSEVSDE